MNYRLILTFCCMAAFSCSAFCEESKESIVEKVLNEGSISLEPKDVFVWIDFPKTTKLNSVVFLKVDIQNLRSNEIFKISSIDLGASLSQGFKLKKITPKPKELDSALGDLTAEYDFSVEPGGAKQVIFELVAVKEGAYKGDIDVWEDKNMLTRVAQCRIVK